MKGPHGTILAAIFQNAGWNDLPEPAQDDEVEAALARLSEVLALMEPEPGLYQAARSWAEQRLRRAGVDEPEDRVERAVRRAVGKHVAAVRYEEAILAEQTDPEQDCNFSLQRIRRWEGDPTIFGLTIEGQEGTFAARDLASSAAFRVRFLSVFGSLPIVPPKLKPWVALVNGWLGRAEVIELPPEARADRMLSDRVEQLVENLSISDDAADLDSGRAILWNGQLCFKMRPLLDALRPHENASGVMLARALRDLGFESQTIRIGEQTPRRVWVGPPPAAGGNGAADPQGTLPWEAADNSEVTGDPPAAPEPEPWDD